MQARFGRLFDALRWLADRWSRTRTLLLKSGPTERSSWVGEAELTGMVMGFKGVDDLAAIYAGPQPNNIRDGPAPAFESQPRQIAPVECIEIPGNDKLFLLPGQLFDQRSA